MPINVLNLFVTDDWKPVCGGKDMEFILAFSLGLVKEIYWSISSGKLKLDALYFYFCFLVKINIYA